MEVRGSSALWTAWRRRPHTRGAAAGTNAEAVAVRRAKTTAKTVRMFCGTRAQRQGKAPRRWWWGQA